MFAIGYELVVSGAIQYLLGFTSFRNYFFETMVKGKVKAQTKGLFPAPLLIADVSLEFCVNFLKCCHKDFDCQKVIREGLENGTEAGMKKEAEGFGKLSQTNESKALIGLYSGQTYCKKNRYGKPQKKVEYVFGKY